MDLASAMQLLESLGTEQNRKTYRRHGAREPLFGVSFANLYKVQKQIKRDHALALQLWESGNVDAMMLATLIADPAQLSEATIDAWLGAISYYPQADFFGNLVARTAFAEAKLVAWSASEEEWTGRVGWTLLGQAALKDRALSDSFFEPYLDMIERGIHAAKNRAREAMNSALIAIGTRSDELEAKAIAAAKRIGKVEIDHGDTACLTPDAASYIVKARAHQRQKKTPTIIRGALEAKVAAPRPQPTIFGMAASGYTDTSERAGDERPEPRAFR